MRPVVSILAPCYGHEAYVDKALESVIRQDFEDWELILIDDCSPDDSFERARSVRDPRIQVHRNETNLGAYATQARALAMAQGQWVAILNTDDVWQPGKLSRQLASAGEHAWVYALGELIDEHGRTLRPADLGNWPTGASVELLPHMLVENRLLASSVMFRRGAAEFEASLRTSGDWRLALDLAWVSPAACVAEPLVAWRQHPHNSYVRSASVTLEEIRVRRAILLRMEAWRTGRFSSSLIDVGLGRCALNQCALYILAGFPRKARRMADLAVRLLPGDRTAARRRLLSRLPLVASRRRLWGTARSEIRAADVAGLADLRMPCDEKTLETP